VTSNFIRGQAMPDNFTLIWLQAANFNILLVEAILLRDAPVCGFKAKVNRYWQHGSCTPFTARLENFGPQLGIPTIRRNVYIPQSANVGGDHRQKDYCWSTCVFSVMCQTARSV
jgi:hypothetical protein